MLAARPTAAELVAAVAGFLEQQAAPQLDARTAFHAKVAVNVLRIVERELLQGAAAAVAERSGLAALTGLPADGDLAALQAALCSAIDSGQVDSADPALHAHLLRSVLARIDIDSPQYASRRHAPAG